METSLNHKTTVSKIYLDIRKCLSGGKALSRN